MSVDLNTLTIESSAPPLFNEEMRGYRSKGYEILRNEGLPGNKTEHWMKFDISPLKEKTYFEATEPGENTHEPKSSRLEKLCETVEIVNGILNKNSLNGKYNISTIDTEEGRENLSTEIGRLGDGKGQYFYNLNRALFRDPLLIRISSEKAKRAPLYLRQILTGSNEPRIINPRIIIILEEGAELDLVQSFNCEGETDNFNNSVTEIYMGKGAKLSHYTVLADSEKSSVFNNLYVEQMENSEYRSRTLISNTSLSRNETHIALAGRNSMADTGTLYLGTSDYRHNSDITIRHESPGCRSWTGARAIGGDDTQGVFRGFAIISKGAQKSDAVQQFKSILLNDRAQMNMEPHLEIWADDVKCSHGATVGQLDKNQLFYLQTRGYSEEEARKVLLRAFAAELADSVPVKEIKDVVADEISRLMDRIYE